MILGGTNTPSSGSGVQLPTVRCERRTPHPAHTYIANPRSGIDLQCPGLVANRSIAQLLAAQPALVEVPLVGIVRYVLEVSAA